MRTENQNITLTKRVRILPNESQKALLIATMKAYSEGCNYASEYVFEFKDMDAFSVHHVLYHEIRDKFKLKSNMAGSTIRTAVAKYKTLKSNQHDWTLVHFKKLQYDLVWNRDYSLIGEVFSINTLEGRIKVPFVRKYIAPYLNSNYKFGTARLVIKNGKFYLYIPVTFKTPDYALSNTQTVVGIDRGINFIITSVDNHGRTRFVNGREIKRKRAKFKKIRGQLQKKHTSSARRRLKAIGNRENRWMNDTNHCISKALVSEYPADTIFILEDLSGIQSALTKVRRRQRSTMGSWAYGDLEQKISYKAKLKGSKVIKVNPAYTSQTCPVCGHVEKANRNKKQHEFQCKVCGYRSNDDRVASINLLNRGIDWLRTNFPEVVVVDGYNLFTRGFIGNPMMQRQPEKVKKEEDFRFNTKIPPRQL